MTSSRLPTAVLAIRPAFAEDAADVARLAALDSAPVPRGELLLGVVDGHALAAVSVDTGAAVADPFAPTAELVGLLRQRGASLRTARAPAGPAGRLRRVARRARASTA